ncbi:MAG: alpha/beta hydrolase [Methanolobus sp.]|nr:alpha/beta hydrolase [Methanolobus sp.]
MDKVRSKDGTLIAYERSGAGPPLVLVHGTTADHTRWASVLPKLEERFTVYAVDRRGRGQSGDSLPYSLEREYEDIAAVMDSIREPVNLLGHSYGALISLEAALLATNLNKLILYEPAIRMDESLYLPNTQAKIQKLLDQDDREGVLQVFFREVVGMPEQEIARLKKEPAWTARLASAHTLFREFADDDYVFDPMRFKGLKVPTLLLSGSESPDMLKTSTKAVHTALPNSRIAIMPGQQHIAMSTAPDLFVRLVVEFLTQ